MVPKKIEQRLRARVEAIVGRTLGATPLPPDILTVMTLVLTLAVFALLVQGSLFWAGALFLVASAFDMLDGALARAKHATSRFGAFLDSTIDRYSEVILMLGLLIYFQRSEPAATIYPILLLIAASGSLLTSYVRARAESLGFTASGGLVERPERVIILGVGMLTGWTIMSLWLIAVLSHITAAQRFFSVWQQSRAERDEGGKLPAAKQSNPG